MSRLTVALLLALSLVPAGCSLPLMPDARPSLDAAAGEPLPLRRLRPEPHSFAYFSGMEDSARVVVREASAWRDVWQTLWRGHSPQPALPAVDFDRDMLVVAALGTRNSGGYSIYVDSAYLREDHVEVVVRKVSPGRGCAVAAALTRPVDIAALPRIARRVRFLERSAVRHCD